MSAHAEPIGHAHHGRKRERASAADPLQLADQSGHRRDLPVHRVGDHAVRLVLHGLLLRPGRQQRRPPGAVAAVHARHAHPVRAAVVPGARQHADPGHLELHDALGDRLGEEEQPRRALRRDGADAAPRPDVPADAGDRVPPARLQHERHRVRVDVLRADRAARLPRLHRPSRSCSR